MQVVRFILAHNASSRQQIKRDILHMLSKQSCDRYPDLRRSGKLH